METRVSKPMPISSYWIFIIHRRNMAKSMNLHISECVMLFYLKKYGSQVTAKWIFNYIVERRKLLEEGPERKEVVLFFLIPFIITKLKNGGLRNGSEVQSQYCSFRRPNTVHSALVRQLTSPLSNSSSRRVWKTLALTCTNPWTDTKPHIIKR